MLVNNLGKDDPEPCNFSLEWDGETPENDFPNHYPHHILILYHLSPPPPVNNYTHAFTDLFKILNINQTSNKREVTVAFRTLARIYQPDKYYDNIRKFSRDEGEEKFKVLSNAYEDLKNSNTLF